MIKQKKTGQVIVISAPSGAGKDTVVKELMKNNPNSRWVSVSATSRAPREGEQEGVDYYYLSKEEFEQKIEEGFFLEYTNYAGNYYGTPKKYIQEKVAQGTDVILIIEIEGAANIKKLIPEAVFIFIMPPSLKELVRRLKKRGTETDEKILKRFHTAYKEINEVTKYNYVVVNDKLEDAVNKVESILNAEKCRVDRIEEVFLDTKEEEIHELLMEKDFDNAKQLVK
ncbi:MAG: guanylate kinase [Bacilli bacterium]|nr:guanylate kinase [Bacilli bacterium]